MGCPLSPPSPFLAPRAAAVSDVPVPPPATAAGALALPLPYCCSPAGAPSSGPAGATPAAAARVLPLPAPLLPPPSWRRLQLQQLTLRLMLDASRAAPSGVSMRYTREPT